MLCCQSICCSLGGQSQASLASDLKPHHLQWFTRSNDSFLAAMLRNGQYECEHLGCTFVTNEYLEMRRHFDAHGRAQRSGGPFHCDVCGDMFTTRLEVHNHRCVACAAAIAVKRQSCWP